MVSGLKAFSFLFLRSPVVTGIVSCGVPLSLASFISALQVKKDCGALLYCKEMSAGMRNTEH